MTRDEFWHAMTSFAFDTYLKRKAGLSYSIQFNKAFTSIMEKDYRMKQYKENGELFMTSNERLFHLISFIDGLSWLVNQGLVDTDVIQSIAKGNINIGNEGESYDGLTTKEKYISGAQCVNAMYWYELLGNDAWD